MPNLNKKLVGKLNRNKQMIMETFTEKNENGC